MKKQNRRERGTGTIEKKGHHFYLKIRIGGRAKSTLLLGPDDKPVTTRKDAEAAAKLLQPVLRAEQKEEIALHIANARKLRQDHSFPIKALQHDFDNEKEFSYKNLSPADMISHFAKFISGIWQIHPFREGNTRTTAVFAIKYLRAMGFPVSNDLFAEHSWYFRNALVRANYRNYASSIEPELEHIEKFFRNLLLGENNELKNRYLIISAPEDFTPQADPTSAPQEPHKLIAEDPFCQKLILAIGNDSCSVRTMMEQLKLSDRKNFLKNYLNPAIKAGFVRLFYPDSPRHPRQKYLLTVKGLAAFQQLQP